MGIVKLSFILVRRWLAVPIHTIIANIRSRLVLFAHHFDCTLSTLKIKLVIVILLLICIFLGCRSIIQTFSDLGLLNFWQFVFRSKVHRWQRKLGSVRSRVFTWKTNSVSFFTFVGCFDSILPSILHQHQMCILVRSLFALFLFNSFVQEVDSLVIFVFELRLNTLILNILQLVHLQLICDSVCGVWTASGWITSFIYFKISIPCRAHDLIWLLSLV